MASPKKHAVGYTLIVVKLESYMVLMLHLGGKFIKIIKEHMY